MHAKARDISPTGNGCRIRTPVRFLEAGSIPRIDPARTLLEHRDTREYE